MYYKKWYYYFRSALSEKFCDDIVSRAMDDNPIQALTGGYSTVVPRSESEVRELFKKRDSNILWAKAWIKKELEYYYPTNEISWLEF